LPRCWRRADQDSSGGEDPEAGRQREDQQCHSRAEVLQRDAHAYDRQRYADVAGSEEGRQGAGTIVGVSATAGSRLEGRSTDSRVAGDRRPCTTHAPRATVKTIVQSS
jgi:hypothetical protein